MAGFSMYFGSKFYVLYSKFYILPKVLDIVFLLYIMAGLLHMSIGMSNTLSGIK